MSRMASMQVLNNAFSNLNNAMATIMQNNRQNRQMDINEQYYNDLLRLKQEIADRNKFESDRAYKYSIEQNKIAQENAKNLRNQQLIKETLAIGDKYGENMANVYRNAMQGDPLATNLLYKGIEEYNNKQSAMKTFDTLLANFDKLKEWKLKQEQNYFKNTLEADKFLWGVRKDKDAQRLELEKFRETQKQNKIKNDLNQKKADVLTPEQVNNLLTSQLITEEEARAYIQRHYPELQSQGDAKSKAQQMFSTKK